MATQFTAGLFPDQPLLLNARTEALRIFAVPAAIGFILGWFGATNTEGGTRFVAATIWIALSVCAWITNDVCTRLISGTLRKRGIGLVWSLLTGFLVATPFNIVVNLSFGELFQHWGFNRRGLETLLDVNPSLMVSSALVPLAIWMIGNLLFWEVKQATLYGYRSPRARSADSPVSSASVQAAAPAFLNKVRQGLRGHVYAVCAELHYIRVFTEFGTDLVHYRFKDAVAEFALLNGAQIHRSWAICRDDIVSSTATHVTLRNGMTIPVGRSFKQRLR